MVVGPLHHFSVEGWGRQQQSRRQQSTVDFWSGFLMVLLLGPGGGADVREEDVETDVKLSSNELVIVPPGSTLLSFPLSVVSLSINYRTTEDREVTSGGRLVVA